MGAPAGFSRVTDYEVWLYGPQGGVPSYNDMQVKMNVQGVGIVTCQMDYRTEQALPRIRFLVDLLRNEKNVFVNPQDNTLAVFQEEVGEKDT